MGKLPTVRNEKAVRVPDDELKQCPSYTSSALPINFGKVYATPTMG